MNTLPFFRWLRKLALAFGLPEIVLLCYRKEWDDALFFSCDFLRRPYQNQKKKSHMNTGARTRKVGRADIPPHRISIMICWMVTTGYKLKWLKIGYNG